MSQEYTPTEWVDETATSQGTLINAARMNNLETAHHYADGFEEVDAIPTADPGVGYHKVVYCTADTTFYRWDGTAWTADIDDDTRARLDAEIARATAAETVLQDNIDAEASARTSADTALRDALTAEETARTSADTALGERISTETVTREGADIDLGSRIDSEGAARSEADAHLQDQIDELMRGGRTVDWETIMHVYEATSYTVTHSLGGIPSSVEIYLRVDEAWKRIYTDWQATNETITVSFDAVPVYGSALRLKAII